MSALFRRFLVESKTPESANITSFHLSPVDGEPMWAAEPGQYLTLRLPSLAGQSRDGQTLDEASFRTYSISTDASRRDGTRITVKRESTPQATPDAPPGAGSSWLHDHVEPGTEIDIAAPRGSFVLDRGSDRPVVLLSGGVGQTPLLSMLHELARGKRDAWYVHACQNGDVHALHDEVKTLVSNAGGRLRHHVVYRMPSDADRQAQRFHGEGLITRETMQSLLPIDDYECYLCGPTRFMVAQYRLLTSLGVQPDRIAYEFFGKGASLAVLAQEQSARELLESKTNDAADRSASRAGCRAPAALAGLAHLTDPDARAAGQLDPPLHDAQRRKSEPANLDAVVKTDASSADAACGAATVLFARSGVEVMWSSHVGSLLELAEQAGLAPAFSCRSGICNTCLCTIHEGAVDYIEEPLLTPAPGTALICCSRPAGRIVLEL